jgi:hypothetical protein
VRLAVVSGVTHFVRFCPLQLLLHKAAGENAAVLSFCMHTKLKSIVPALIVAIAAGMLFYLQQAKISQLEAKLPQPRIATAKKSGGAPEQDNLTALKRILAIKDPLLMLRDLSDFVSGLNEAGIRPLLDYLAEHLVQSPGTIQKAGPGTNAMLIWAPKETSGLSSNNHQLALSLMLDRLMRLNPDGTLAWANSVSSFYDRDKIITKVFIAWSNSDVTRALAAANQLADPRLRESVLGQLAQNLIGTNPPAALAALQSLPLNKAFTSTVSQVFASWSQESPQAALAAALNLAPNHGRNEAVQSAVQGWASVDPQAALAWADTLPNGVTHTQAVNAAIGALALQDPQQAINYVANITNIPNRNATMIQVAGYWAQNDPKAAADWIQQNASGLTLKQAMVLLMDPLSKVDPSLAADYLAKMPMPGIGSDLTSLPLIAQNWAAVDPQADLVWLKSLGNSNLGTLYKPDISKAAIDALTTWADNDPDAAAAYVESLGAQDPQFYKWIATVAASRAMADPVAAAAWLQSLPDFATRHEAVNNVASQLAAADPLQAIHLALQMPATGGWQNMAIGNVVAHVAAADPQQALDLAQQLPAGSTQDSAVASVISAWSTTDPATAAKSLQNLPAGSILENTTQNVVAYWIQSDPVAAAQWINSQPAGAARDVAIREEVKALTGSNSPEAFQWAASIGNTTMQGNQMSNVVQSWIRSDPAAAAAAVQSADISEATRSRLRAILPKSPPL